MPAPIIPASVPDVVAPVAEKVYDRWRFVRLSIDASGPNEPVVGVVTVRKSRIDADGRWEDSPASEPVHMRIDDVMSEAAVVPEIAQAVGAVLAVAAAVGAQRGVL